MRILRRLNPFGGLEHPTRVWAWGMFDLANQSFTLLINTLLFGVFFKVVVAGDPTDPAPGERHLGDLLWAAMVAASLFTVVAIGPIVGAYADCRAWKKRILVGSGVLCALLTCALALIPASDDVGRAAALAIAIALYVPANIAFNLGENFLASFLPEISPARQIGRVSATGWAMGYVGALLLLALTAGAMTLFDFEAKSSWRPLFVFAGVWFLAASVPTMLLLPEAARAATIPEGRTAAGVAFDRVRDALRHAGRFRDLAVLLSAFLVYAFGVQAVIFFAGIIIEVDFEFGNTERVLFLLVITISAGASAIGAGFVQDWFGHKRTVASFLVVWIVASVGLAVLSALRLRLGEDCPIWPVWVIGNLVGIGLGGIGSATRAFVGFLTPAHRTAEFFGLWGLTYKLAGGIGVLAFGLVRSAMGPVASSAALAGFFVIGLVVLTRVDERRGYAAAVAAEAAGASPHPVP